MRGPSISVLMPTFDQAAFLPRAVEGLLAQTHADWELVVVDDGSDGSTAEALAPYRADPRVRYERRERNEGLGAACNLALDLASAPLVAYLPSDDVWFDGHLASLVELLGERPDAVLAFSGVRSEQRVPGKGVLGVQTSEGQIEGLALRLVQVAHRRTDDRWVERRELVTDDLDAMFWSKLRPRGRFVGSGAPTCEWVDHPQQWHKVVREPLGGVNPYRSRYGVRHPLRFATTVGNRTDEIEHYRRFRERPDTPAAPDGLTILLVGELAFNPERILALEERGHRLYGLWTPDPHWFNAVGPVPFGHVTDVPRQGWRSAVRDLAPDVIYALLNWQAVPFAHEVLDADLGVPFVWHFKEGPFDCIANGTWNQLLDLVTQSDAQVYASPEMRDWFAGVDPRIIGDGRPMVLDGDLPKADWFTAEPSRRLSELDGEIHTVVPGAPVGITTALVTELAEAGVHLHFYGDFHRAQWTGWAEACAAAAPAHFHLHPQVDHGDWVTELSRYDAGWLHQLRSANRGDLRRADWGDLNCPARLATYAVSGLPMILPDNDGAVMATQSVLRRLDIGVFYRDTADLLAALRDTPRMTELRENAWSQRREFVFDHHADRLVALFRQAMASR